MLVALVVGALTAWYLGLRLGLVAAGVAFVAIVVAGIVPGLTLTVYGLIIGWCALLYLVGSRLRATGPKPASTGLAGVAGSALGTVGKWAAKAKKLVGGDR